MPAAKHHIPEGHRSLTPHLIVDNGLDAIAFYQKAFGAELRSHAPAERPGSTMHAELRIGDSALFLTDMIGPVPVRPPSAGGAATAMMHVFVADCDAVFNRAVAAGAKVVMPPSDMFWGDRYGQVADPFGHVWSIATHKEDVTPEEMQTRAQTFWTQQKPPHA
jgi:PhnB protein